MLGVGCHYYFEFDGEGVDAGRLEEAVRRLIRRHGMLRARFRDDGRQQIMAEGSWPGLTVRDLRDESEAEVGVVLSSVRDRESNRRLDVGRGRGLTSSFRSCRAARTGTHVNVDMLVADATSFRILIHELARLYARPDAALPPIASELPEISGREGGEAEPGPRPRLGHTGPIGSTTCPAALSSRSGSSRGTSPIDGSSAGNAGSTRKTGRLAAAPASTG